MEFKLAYKRLLKSPEYSGWKAKHKDSYFSYAFRNEDNNLVSWQLGFYKKQNDRMVSFLVDEEKIEIQKEDDVFKKPEIEVKKLDIDKVKLKYKDILKKARDFIKKNYPKESVNKTIVILQNHEKLGNVWNLTFITNSFCTLNLKLNSEDGKVMEHKLTSIMSFVKK